MIRFGVSLRDNSGFNKTRFLFTFAFMKRQLLITLALMLCVFRSFSGTAHWEAIPLQDANSGLSQLPLLACRYKKPFPFQCVQLIKKRLSNPPDVALVNVCSGQRNPAIPSNNAPFFMTRLPSLVQFGKSEAAALVFFAAHWHTCGIGRNVFHPPPFAA